MRQSLGTWRPALPASMSPVGLRSHLLNRDVLLAHRRRIVSLTTSPSGLSSSTTFLPLASRPHSRLAAAGPGSASANSHSPVPPPPRTTSVRCRATSPSTTANYTATTSPTSALCYSGLASVSPSPSQPRGPMMPMASFSYSTSSSDTSTPRSASPASARSSHTSISNKRMSISSRRMTDLNPMSSVNIAAIEDKMRTASLDQHRGYAQNHYGEVQQYRTTEYVPKSSACGYQVLREPVWNKGMLSPPRDHLHLLGISLTRTPTRPILHPR